MAVQWEDVTSYSRNERGSGVQPRSWSAKFGQITLTVTRHIHYPQDVWLAYCGRLFEHTPLASKVLSEAQCQAVAKLQSLLEESVKALNEAIDQ